MTGVEPFIFGTLQGFLASKAAEEAQKSLAGAVVKSIKPGTLTDQIKQAIFHASGQYITSYADRHG